MYLVSHPNVVRARKVGSLFLALGFLATAVLTSGPVYARAYTDSEIREVESPDESKVRDLRDEEITQLRIALGRRAAVNRRADLYLRLAEIDLEGYRATYLLEGRVHERKLSANQDDKLIDHTHSRPYLLAGIKACREILSFGIDYPKMDQVYYFLGFNYGELGDRKESLKYYADIVEKFPQSPFVSEAYREQGDEAYSNLNFKKAQTYYEVAVRTNTGETAARVLHKLAWAYYRTKNFDKAIATMKEAISVGGKSGEKFISLREEALRDMAVFMTEAGKVEEAIQYFQSVAGDKSFYPKVLEKLGHQYERNVEPAKATQVYESLLKTDPDSQEAFRVTVKLVDLDLRRGRFKEALARLNVKFFTDGDGDTKVAYQNLRAMIRRTATEHHELYRKKNQKPDLEIAESYYGAYLSFFLAKEDPRNETPEIEMYLAEVKRDLGKAGESAELYRRVLETKDKRYAKEAGALWTASLAEAIKKAGANKTGQPSALENEYVEAADRLQDALGDTSEGREAALKAAEVLAGYPATKKSAIKRIQHLLETSPKSPQALTGARLWIQIASEDPNQPDELADVMSELRKNTVLMATDKEIGGGKLKTLISENDVRQKIKVISTAEKKSDFPAAARDYESFASDSTQRDPAEKAYTNAVSNYARAEDGESIDRVYADWSKRFPKSPKAADALRSTATHFLIIGKFDLSIHFFERLSKDTQDPDALETAARIAEGNENIEEAELLRTRYAAEFPDAAGKYRVALDLALMRIGNQKEAEAAKPLQFCQSAPNEIGSECGSRLADLYLRSGDTSSAKSAYRKVAAQLPKKKGEALPPFVAYARYKLAEMLETETRLEPLALPEDKLKKALGQKLDFLETLSRAYVSAVDAGGPWAIAALNRQAAWVYHFAEEVDSIAIPEGTSAASAAKFRKNLASVSGPLKKKAITTWSEGYSKAVSNEFLSPAVPELVDHLSDAHVNLPARAQGARGKFYLAGITADGGTDGMSVALKATRDKLVKNSKDDRAWVDYGNLLWGSSKPVLSTIAYERALSLNQKNAAALNNRAVVLISGDGEEDWFHVAEGYSLLQSAQSQDQTSLSTRANRASLLSYYRLFSLAKPLWDGVASKAPIGSPQNDSQDGLAVSLQGIGNPNGAADAFRKASEGGASKDRFVLLYNEAARSQPEACLSKLSDIHESALQGFEKSSYLNLKRSCTLWLAKTN